jgi:hypothetical protein
MIPLTVNRIIVSLILLFIVTPVSTANRSVTCEIDEPDWQLGMYVRSQLCLIDTVGTHTDITINEWQKHWVMDLPRAELRTITQSWYGGAWHRTEYADRVLWSGSVKTDQLGCRFGGSSKIRYVFSNDTAICLAQ